jgi:cell division protein FtsB/exonuclease VII small subunit
MENDQKESRNKKLMLGVVIALILIIGVTLYFVYSGHEDNTDLTAQKSTLDSTFHSLSDTLDVRSAELEQITDRNTVLDSTVSAKQAMIVAERGQIAAILKKAKMTKTELEEAKSRITQYETSISELQQKVVELNAQNQQLTQANSQLSDSLSSEKKTTTELNAENKGLSQKVVLGSLLQLREVDVNGVKQRQNGKEITVRYAKAAESLRISFETGQNAVLSAGPLSLYVRIINPAGETISVADQGSGTLQLTQYGTQVQYTKKADITWNQTSKKVLVYWTKNISSPGIYHVEIYQSGYLIGRGQVKLD